MKTEVIGPFEMLSESLLDTMASLPRRPYFHTHHHNNIYLGILVTWLVMLHHWVSCSLHFKGICFLHLQVVVVYPYQEVQNHIPEDQN